MEKLPDVVEVVEAVTKAFIITDRSAEGKISLPFAEKYLGNLTCDIVPLEFESWIYDPQGKYRMQVGRILYVAEEVRKAGGGYREFRRRLGNYGNGFKGIMRSEINNWVHDLEGTQNEGVKVAQYLWTLTQRAQNTKAADGGLGYPQPAA